MDFSSWVQQFFSTTLRYDLLGVDQYANGREPCDLLCVDLYATGRELLPTPIHTSGVQYNASKCLAGISDDVQDTQKLPRILGRITLECNNSTSNVNHAGYDSSLHRKPSTGTTNSF